LLIGEEVAKMLDGFQFTQDQAPRLPQIATQEGTDAERLVKDAFLRLLCTRSPFRSAVRDAIAQAGGRETH
jgi:hypothetical protein